MQTTNTAKTRRWLGAALLLGSAALLSGCHIDQWDQPKQKAYYEDGFFSDHSEMRPVVANTVPHAGALDARLDDAYNTGRGADGKYVLTIPARAVQSFGGPKAMLLRGKDRFDAYCSPCHGYIGDGNGMVSQRGIKYWQTLPASYYTDRLRKVEDGYIYDVLVNGHGVMYGYGSRVQDVDDRWAVVSYVRALQLAHGANENLLPAAEREKVEAERAAKSVPAAPPVGGAGLRGTPAPAATPSAETAPAVPGTREGAR